MRGKAIIIICAVIAATLCNANADTVKVKDLPVAYSFKSVFGDNDPTHPSRSELDDFDRLVLSTCGEWGHKVGRKSIHAMLSDPRAAGYMDKIYAVTDGTMYEKKMGRAEFITHLTNLFTTHGFFQHVFCGSPDRPSGSLGLHYGARITEVQDKQWGGIDSACGIKSHGSLYTIGLEYVRFKKELYKKCPLSFINGLHAGDLMIYIVKAYRDSSVSEKDTCFHREKIDGSDVSFLLRRSTIDDGMLTFYPILNSECDGSSSLRKKCVLCAGQ